MLVQLNFATNAHVGLIWLKGPRPQGRAFESFVDQVAQVFLPEREEEKALRRQQAKQARAAMSMAERTGQSEAVCDRLLRLPEVGAAHVVACYLAHGDELDLGGFMRAFALDGSCGLSDDTSGISQNPARIVALPFTLRGPRLAFVQVDDAELANPETLPHCLREPSRALGAVPAELAGRVIDPADIDVAILPGLAFDTHGTRLGYGGGYYDAWLEEAYSLGGAGKTGKRSGGARRSTSKAPSSQRPFLIGACFDCQLLPPAATLPREPHDIAMDAVVTASRMLQLN